MPNTREKLIELLSVGHECPDGRNPFLEESCSTCPYGKANNCGAEMQADHLIANGVTVQEWISVKDRLPKPFTPVLVYRQSFGTLPPYIKVDKMTLWNDDTQVWTDDVGNWKNVTTHWMPLPQPPKGE